jgi:opacity protein-like surface antigen
MKKLLIFLFLSLFQINVVSSQAIESFGSFGYITFGGHLINLDELNSKLKTHNYNEFENFATGYGGGLHFIISNWILGFDGMSSNFQNNESPDGEFRLSFNGGYTTFNVGYLMNPSSRLLIYPMLGLGSNKVNLRIQQNVRPSFDLVLEKPRRSTELTATNFLINLQVGGDYLISIFPETRTGIIAGLRIGYLYSPLDTKWDIYAIEIDDGPNVNFNGPYARIVLGTGGIRIK